MTDDTFEWVDPFEQKARAEREHHRADRAFSDGRRQVEDTLARAERANLSAKMDLAIASLAERIVSEIVAQPGANAAHVEIARQYGPRIAEEFRKACMRVVRGIDLPGNVEVRARVSGPWDEAPTVTFRVESLKRIDLAIAAPL